jgi:hypothetical protein
MSLTQAEACGHQHRRQNPRSVAAKPIFMLETWAAEIIATA